MYVMFKERAVRAEGAKTHPIPLVRFGVKCKKLFDFFDSFKGFVRLPVKVRLFSILFELPLVEQERATLYSRMAYVDYNL